MTDGESGRVSGAERAPGETAANHTAAKHEHAGLPQDEPAPSVTVAHEPVSDEPTSEVTVTEETVTAQTVRVRRTPRYARFMLVGALVCIAVAFILTYSFPQGDGYDRNAVFGYMALVAIAVGVVLGSLAALLAARLANRKAQTLVADRIDVSTADAAAHHTPGGDA